MMRIDTEKKLATHLMNLANHEKTVEQERILLNEIYNFNPNSAFKRVDRYKNYKINAYDLSNFMRDNGFKVYAAELTDLVKIYDVDNDGNLDTIEFSNIMLTATDMMLRRRARERNEQQVEQKDRLSYQIENRMATILAIEMEGIKKLHEEKEILKNRYDFSRLDAFRAIDRYKMNSLLRDDLRLFLNIHGFNATALDADHLMRRLDQDKDGRITYAEFVDYMDSINLNNLAQEQSQDAIPSHSNQMNSNNKQQLVSYTPQKPNRSTGLIEQRNDRLVQSAPKELDHIERNRLVYGIRVSNTQPLRKVVSSAINNTSRNLNEKQTLTKQDKYLPSHEKGLSSQKTTPSPYKEVYNQNTQEKAMKTTERKKLAARRLDLDNIQEEGSSREGSFGNNTGNQKKYLQQHNQKIKEQQYELQDNELEQQQQRNHTASQYTQQSGRQSYYLPPLEADEQIELVEVLNKMIQIESETEKSKQQLALKADFNLLDAFKFFDRYNAGEIYKKDMEDAFIRLGVYAQSNEIDLLFKRYDRNGDHRIRYLEFVDAFTPKDRIYANHLQNKKPNYQASNASEAMSKQTRINFADTIRVMLKNEGYVEEMRQKLAKRYNFSISAAFSTIDVNNNSCLTQEEMKIFLEDHEFFVTQKEMDLLFSRMDRDQDGKIAYNEFFAEIAPKH